MSEHSSWTRAASLGGGAGISLGAAMAVVLSWNINQSVGWALLHGMCGWFYLLYLCAGYGGGFDAAKEQPATAIEAAP